MVVLKNIAAVGVILLGQMSADPTSLPVRLAYTAVSLPAMSVTSTWTAMMAVMRRTVNVLMMTSYVRVEKSTVSMITGSVTAGWIVMMAVMRETVKTRKALIRRTLPMHF